MRRTVHTRGSAMTELVILVPVLVMTIYMSMYLTELGVFRLKAQEIARYGAWSMAVRPLSDFEEFEHRELQKESRDSALNEMERLYVDLDGQDDRFEPIVGKSGEYMSAFWNQHPEDIRLRPTQMLPGALSYDWSSPLSSVGMILSLTGIGTGTQDLFSGPFRDMQLNENGEARGRSRVHLMPPMNARDLAQTAALVEYGRDRGIDLRRWQPLDTVIRDRGQDGQLRDIEIVLVADPWRIERGYTAKPKGEGPYTSAVAKVHDKSPTSFPGGAAIGMLMDLGGLTDGLAGISAAFLGKPPDDPAAHVFSRPYADDRDGSGPGSGMTSGRVDIFSFTEAERAEDGAVRHFETMPFYLDHSGNSGYLESFEKRGRNFMGCKQSQQRRCRW